MSVQIDGKLPKKLNLTNLEKTVSLIEAETKKELQIKDQLEINLLFVNDRKIKKINKDTRDKNESTDVLSFPLETKIGDILFLGDIIISLDTATKQAKKMGNTLEEELAFLFCHGLLHLLGYDHMTKKEKEEMFKLQDKLLERILD